VVKLAEQRNLRRAATVLGLPPGVLAREISRVETAIGTLLFDRSPRRVVPTRAGEEMCDLARRSLAADAREKREMVPGGALRIGWMDWGRGQAIQRATLAEFQAQYPHVPVQLLPRSCRDQLSDLRDGVLDVGFYTGPTPVIPGITVEMLLPVSVDAALLPADHPFADVDGLSLADLSAFPFHSLSPEYAPEIMDRVHESLSRAGWRGHASPGSLHPSEVITAVSCGVGWSTVPLDLTGWTPAGVSVVPVIDEPLVGLDVYVLWREDAPLARAFGRLAFEFRDVIGGIPGPGGDPPTSEESAYRRLLEQRYVERVRIMGELHDTLLQDIVGSGLQIETLRRGLPVEMQRENEELDRVAAQLDQAARGVRSVLERLPPAHNDPRDLLLVLSAAAERLGRDSPTPFRISAEGTALPLYPDVEEAAFGVAIEALTYALRRADATLITVAVEYRVDAFTLCVTDDGRGTSAVDARSSQPVEPTGVSNMADRAAAVGGSLTIRLGRNGGNEVELVVPAERAYAE
jgi:DNA-binding transcriptional LysR family regulator